MSEIASKANSGPSSSLTQPSVTKGGDAAHEMLFAALFGSVVAVEPDSDTMLGGIAQANANADSDGSPDGNSDILSAMQAVAVMMSGKRGAGQEGKLSAESERLVIDDSVIADDDDTVGANPMMIGPMPLQQQAGTNFPAAETSALMAQMALEDDAVMPHQRKGPAALNTSITALHASGAQSRVAELSLASSQKAVKAAEQPQSQIDSIGDMPANELDNEFSQLRSRERPLVRPAPTQHNISQAGLINGKSANGFDQALTDMVEDVQFDGPDDFLRAVARQTERGVGGMGSQSASGESLSANAVRQMQAGGLSVGAQMSQPNNGQTGGQSSGQSGGFISASAGMTNGSMMDMLDMAQDNWTEMLFQRVEKGLSGGKDKIDFHLNPRNLGKMRISLVVHNDRTHVHIQTDTSMAAQLLSDGEARLAQMMDVSGLKFGNLTSQYNQNLGGNFNGHNSGQDRNGGEANAAASDAVDGKNETKAEISVEQSENLINIQA